MRIRLILFCLVSVGLKKDEGMFLLSWLGDIILVEGMAKGLRLWCIRSTVRCLYSAAATH